jgi:protease-4
MSDFQQPPPPPPLGHEPPPPVVIPVRYPPPPPPPPRRPQGSGLGALFRAFLLIALAISVGVNLLLLFALGAGGLGDGGGQLHERYHSGKTSAHEKIAIVRIDGVLMEGMTAYYQKQIEQAAEDKNVRAVVLRINSPGGSITSSDDLHKRLRDLAENLTPNQKGGKKKIVVSMGSVAASGGYYIAMPAERLVAERTTITGSIGVYASFPNVAELADKWGIRMNTIKAGEVKDSGSMFKKMSPEERQLWQSMVDHAFNQFLHIVEDGRPKLKGKLREVVIKEEMPEKDEQGNIVTGKDGKPKTFIYERKRADGGIYTADQALKYGLIDQIGYLEDAIKEAQKAANLGDDYRVVKYDRPLPGLLGLLAGSEGKAPTGQLDADRLAAAAMPRLWYLAPQSELAGLLAAMGRESN